MLKSFRHAFGDLFALHFSSKKNRDPSSYAFLVHLRGIDDLYRKFPFFKIFPEPFLEFISRFLWPMTVSQITGLKKLDSNEEVPGWVIGIPLSAAKMMGNRRLALKKIIEAVRLANAKGIGVIGLGALTASLTRGGLDLVDHTEAVITTGHAYTIYNITQTILAIMRDLHLVPKDSVLAVVGAGGSIGSGSARLLAEYPFNEIILIDVSRKSESIQKLFRELKKDGRNITTSDNISSVLRADFVVTATNTPEALIRASNLKPGAVVVDDAQPSDIHKDVYERQDVLVLEAGAVHTPGVSANFDIDLKNKEDNFSCMAELMILASQGYSESYGLGGTTIEQVKQIAELGNSLGFKISEYQNQYEKISPEKINIIKKIKEV